MDSNADPEQPRQNSDDDDRVSYTLSDLDDLTSEVSSLGHDDNIEVWNYDDDVNGNVANANSESNLRNMDRKTYLLHAPFRVQGFINSADFDGLRELLNDICVKNCTLQTRAMTSESPNCRRDFVEMFATVVESRPDFVMSLSRSVYHRRYGVIVSYITTSGTQCFRDTTNGHLYDLFNHGRPGDGVDENLRARFLAIQNAGQRCRVTVTGRMIWTLTLDHTRVKRVVFATNVSDVSEVHESDDET
jgi:hypothetical protein